MMYQNPLLTGLRLLESDLLELKNLYYVPSQVQPIAYLRLFYYKGLASLYLYGLIFL